MAAAEERRDKTQVLLERAKQLKEEERWALSVGLALLAAFTAAARVLGNRLLGAALILTGLLVAAGAAAISRRIRREAEELWGTLLRDPRDRIVEIGYMLIYAGIIAFGVIMLIATLLGKW